MNLKKVHVRTKKEKKKKTLRKRFKKACRTRWLSTEQSIDSVFEDYEALLQTVRIFKEDGDTTATRLLSEVRNIKFLGAVYLLHKTLPQLSNLSKAFQKGAVSFAAVSPAVDYNLDELDNVANNFSFISGLKNDLKKDGRLSRRDLGISSQFYENQRKNLTAKYIKALKKTFKIDLVETSLLSLYLKYSILFEFLRGKKLDLKSMEQLRLKCWQTTCTSTKTQKAN